MVQAVMKDWVDHFKHSLVWLLTVLASLVSAMSLIKLILFGFDIGLVPVLEAIIDWYRVKLKPFYDLVQLLFWFTVVQEWMIDLFLLYAIGVGITFRLEFSSRRVTIMSYYSPWQNIYRVAVYSIFRPYNIYLAISMYKSLARSKGTDTFNASLHYGFIAKDVGVAGAKYMIRALLSIALIPIAVIIFFAYNEL